jgi:hypothetical protein
VRRDDLDVFDLSIAVRSLVLDPNVGKMDVAVDHRKVTAGSPLRDVGGVVLRAGVQNIGSVEPYVDVDVTATAVCRSPPCGLRRRADFGRDCDRSSNRDSDRASLFCLAREFLQR